MPPSRPHLRQERRPDQGDDQDAERSQPVEWRDARDPSPEKRGGRGIVAGGHVPDDEAADHEEHVDAGPPDVEAAIAPLQGVVGGYACRGEETQDLDGEQERPSGARPSLFRPDDPISRGHVVLAYHPPSPAPLRLAGAGLAAAPRSALAASEGAVAAAGHGPTSAIWTEFFKGQRIWAYADRQSLRPGERLNIMAAGGPGQPVRARPAGGVPDVRRQIRRRCGPATSPMSGYRGRHRLGRRYRPWLAAHLRRRSTPAAGRRAATTPTSSSRPRRRGTSRPPSGS